MNEANYPTDLLYHEAHDWAKIDEQVGTLGITWHAQDALGDIVYFSPPAVGDKLRAGDSYGELESVKAVSDVIAPLDGEVIEVNDLLVDTPEQINEDPYGAWLVRIKITNLSQLDSLLGAEAYKSLVGA